MRYMLYGSNADKVLLDNEIEYIRNYIALQQLRLKKENFAEFKIQGKTGGKMIAPMMLIPFVENAFKHGKKEVNPPGIIINLNINNAAFSFEIKNYSKDKTVKNQDENNGLGLNNVKRRLEILYHNKFNLNINHKNNMYKVVLQIQMD